MLRRVFRVGVDVGGTFTKAVVVDEEARVVGRGVAPTTYRGPEGIAGGVVEALRGALESSGVDPAEVGVVALTTTHNVNALLEGDLSVVGLVVMADRGYAEKALRVTRRSSLEVSPGKRVRILYRFVETRGRLPESRAREIVEEMIAAGAEALAVNEAFGVDDPANERLLAETARAMGVPATAGHELSLVYGLEVRTITSVINSSILPRMHRVAEAIRRGVSRLGLECAVNVVTADGGASPISILESRPVKTLMSGPAASLVGALYRESAANAVLVEVGGTTTNVGLILGGRAPLTYIKVLDYPTVVRGVDVAVIGVGGGSLPRVSGGRLVGVGPRSAHIAGMRYASFSEPDEVEDAEPVVVEPVEGDPREYLALEGPRGLYAFTTTCAANALGIVPEHSPARGSRESALAALRSISRMLSMEGAELARLMLEVAVAEVVSTVKALARRYGASPRDLVMLGAGGAAHVLVPLAAARLGMEYRISGDADVLAAIGAATGMISETLEKTVNPSSPVDVDRLVSEVYEAVLSRGADPSTVTVTLDYISGSGTVRATAVGMLPVKASTAPSPAGPENLEEAAGAVLGLERGGLRVIASKGRFYVVGHRLNGVAGLLGRIRWGEGELYRLAVVDWMGRILLAAEKAVVARGGASEVLGRVARLLERSVVAPEVYVVRDNAFIDLSFIPSPSRLAEALRAQLEAEDDALVIVKLG